MEEKAKATAPKRRTTQKKTVEATPKASDVQPTKVASKPEVVEEDIPIVVKDIDIHQYITVKNGFHGKLIYKSKHTGELFQWDEFGDEQELELKELKDAKSFNKDMFINNYFMFDEQWVIKYLGMEKYYKYNLDEDHIEDFLNKKPEELRKAVKNMPDGQKRSLTYLVHEKVESGEIDSVKTISALEDALGISLIER